MKAKRGRGKKSKSPSRLGKLKGLVKKGGKFAWKHKKKLAAAGAAAAYGAVAARQYHSLNKQFPGGGKLLIGRQ